MLKTYKNANGQTVAQDGAGVWRIYHPTTGSFGVFASAPDAEALKHPVEVQHPATFGAPPLKPEPKVDPLKIEPKVEPLRVEPRQNDASPPATNYWPHVGALAAVLLFAVWAGNGFPLPSGWVKSPPAIQQTAAPASGPIKAIEVEVIPLSAKKEDTHAHVLHATACAGNDGKRVKVRVNHPTVPGLKGWDWYTCPAKTT